MSGKRTESGYAVKVVRGDGVYYLCIEELGLAVHGQDLANAYDKIEKQKDAVLARHAEAGVRPPAPGGAARASGPIAWLALLAAGAALGLLLAGGPQKSRPQEAADIKPLIAGLSAQIETSLGAIMESVQSTGELTRRMVNPNVWSRQGGGNGHYYKVVVPKNLVTWKEAAQEAGKMGGYLATIENPAENDFVYSLIENRKEAWTRHGPYRLGPWIGGYYDGRWKWAAGGLMDGFANWVEGHPVTKDESKTYGVNFFEGPAWISNEAEYRLSSFVLEIEID